MVCPESTKWTRTSTFSSPPTASARVITSYLGLMPFRSVKFGAAGLWAGTAATRLSGTNEKSPSNSRSLRRTVWTMRQASALASSGFFGTQAGIAKRAASPPMMICDTPPCWAAPGRSRQSASARTTRPDSRRRLEDGLDRFLVGAIALGEGGEGRGGVDRALRGHVQQGRPARLSDLHLGDAAVGEDGEGDSHRLREAGLDLLVPEHPDLLLHAGQVPVAAGVRAVGRAEPRGSDGQAGSGPGRARFASARGRGWLGLFPSLPGIQLRHGVARWLGFGR